MSLNNIINEFNKTLNQIKTINENKIKLYKSKLNKQIGGNNNIDKKQEIIKDKKEVKYIIDVETVKTRMDDLYKEINKLEGQIKSIKGSDDEKNKK